VKRPSPWLRRASTTTKNENKWKMTGIRKLIATRWRKGEIMGEHSAQAVMPVNG